MSHFNSFSIVYRDSLPEKYNPMKNRRYRRFPANNRDTKQPRFAGRSNKQNVTQNVYLYAIQTPALVRI